MRDIIVIVRREMAKRQTREERNRDLNEARALQNSTPFFLSSHLELCPLISKNFEIDLYFLSSWTLREDGTCVTRCTLFEIVIVTDRFRQ